MTGQNGNRDGPAVEQKRRRIIEKIEATGLTPDALIKRMILAERARRWLLEHREKFQR